MNTTHLQPKQPMENDAIMIKKRPPKLNLKENGSKWPFDGSVRRVDDSGLQQDRPLSSI